MVSEIQWLTRYQHFCTQQHRDILWQQRQQQQKTEYTKWIETFALCQLPKGDPFDFNVIIQYCGSKYNNNNNNNNNHNNTIPVSIP